MYFVLDRGKYHLWREEILFLEIANHVFGILTHPHLIFQAEDTLSAARTTLAGSSTK